MNWDRADKAATAILWITLFAALLLSLGCAGKMPEVTTAIPAKLELQLPDPPRPPDYTGLTDFNDRGIAAGKCGLPGGILVSDRTYLENIYVYAERDRLRLENKTLTKLRETEWAEIEKAQKAMLERIAETDKRLSWERRLRPIWIVAGVALATGSVLLARGIR